MSKPVSFPMRDGPALPWAFAELLYAAYRRLNGERRTMAALANQGGLSYAHMPTLFQQLNRRDKGLYNDIMHSAAQGLPPPPVLPDPPKPSKRVISTEELNAAPDGRKVPAEAIREADGPRVPLGGIPAGLGPLTVVCWKWNGGRAPRHLYTADHVNVLQRMVLRHYARPHRFICVTDDPKGIKCETMPLWSDHSRIPNPSGPGLPSCYRRLRVFDKETAETIAGVGGRIVSLDLDVILTGDMTPLWERAEDFVGWQVPSTAHGHAYNGSMWLFRAGSHTDLWTKFDPGSSPRQTVAARYGGSDQAWISYMMRGRAAGWSAPDGVYSFPREVRAFGRLPRNARIVIFHGSRKPWDRATLSSQQWIKDHYR